MTPCEEWQQNWEDGYNMETDPLLETVLSKELVVGLWNDAKAAIAELTENVVTVEAERDRLGGVARVYELANETLGKAKYELEEENSRLMAERDRLRAGLDHAINIMVVHGLEAVYTGGVGWCIGTNSGLTIAAGAKDKLREMLEASDE